MRWMGKRGFEIFLTVQQCPSSNLFHPLWVLCDGPFGPASEQLLAATAKPVQICTSGGWSQATSKAERSGFKKYYKKLKLFCWSGPGGFPHRSSHLPILGSEHLGAEHLLAPDHFVQGRFFCSGTGVLQRLSCDCSLHVLNILRLFCIHNM